jgi:uncharacterized protein
MKVHLKQIPPEGSHIEGEDTSVDLDVGNEEYLKCLGPVKYSLDLGLSESGLFATGTLEINLELECVGCLEKFKYPLTVSDFALQTELEGAETVDLTPFVREDILLNLPHYPRCDWDGRKVCQGALQYKSKAGSDKEPKPQQPAVEAWNELDKLKVKRKK